MSAKRISAANCFARERGSPRLKTYGFPDQAGQLGLQKRLSQEGKAAPIRLTS